MSKGHEKPVLVGSLLILSGMLVLCFVACGGSGRGGRAQVESIKKLEPESNSQPAVKSVRISPLQKLAEYEGARSIAASQLSIVRTEKNDLVMQLKATGVRSLSDLKSNDRARRLGNRFAFVEREIEVLERQISECDEAIWKAKALERMDERERAGISDEKMRQLLQEFREADQRIVSQGYQTITPVEVQSALAKILHMGESVPTEKTSTDSEPNESIYSTRQDLPRNPSYDDVPVPKKAETMFTPEPYTKKDPIILVQYLTQPHYYRNGSEIKKLDNLLRKYQIRFFYSNRWAGLVDGRWNEGARFNIEQTSWQEKPFMKLEDAQLMERDLKEICREIRIVGTP